MSWDLRQKKLTARQGQLYKRANLCAISFAEASEIQSQRGFWSKFNVPGISSFAKSVRGESCRNYDGYLSFSLLIDRVQWVKDLVYNAPNGRNGIAWWCPVWPNPKSRLAPERNPVYTSYKSSNESKKQRTGQRAGYINASLFAPHKCEVWFMAPRAWQGIKPPKGGLWVCMQHSATAVGTGVAALWCAWCVSFEAEGQTDDDGSLCCLAKGVWQDDLYCPNLWVVSPCWLQNICQRVWAHSG